LSRFKVIDLTRARAGPTAARHFADWGADVIKVEMPHDASGEDVMGGARDGPDFFNLHRNKRSITLNLKTADGVAILKKLAEGADVLIENYRPDVKHRLGFDYETLRAINPRLVYVSLSGFGQDGPYGNRPGFDQIAQGMGGLMSITGLPGQGPVRVGVPIADLSSGMYAAMGALIALLERDVSGEGQWVHTSLLQAQISMLDFQAARWLVARDVPGQAGNDHPTGIPTGVFPTSDGHINIAASGQHIFARCCKALGAESVLKDPDFANGEKRSKNRKRCNAELGEFTKRYTSAELVEKLNAAGVPSGPIYSVDQMFADPQVQHLGVAVPMQHPTRGQVAIVNQAVTLSRTPCVLDRPTPGLGEHTEEVLGEIGYSKDDIAALRKGKAV
jgi:formyl-CoA transferase